MKRFKKFVAVLAACATIMTMNAWSLPKVSAAEPARHSIKYVDSLGEWRYQATTTWDDNSNGRELYYLKQDIKDGDILLIIGKGGLNLNLDVTLGNLTFLETDYAVVSAKGYQEVYVLKNTTGVINGDVAKAYVYDDSVCNLNNNVTDLFVTGEKALSSTVNVLGTVDKVIINNPDKTSYTCYSFPANTFVMDKGAIKTDYSKFSMTPPAASTTAPSDSADEYDEVPKTGDSYMAFVLLAAAAILFAGSYSLRKKKA